MTADIVREAEILLWGDHWCAQVTAVSSVRLRRNGRLVGVGHYAGGEITVEELQLEEHRVPDVEDLLVALQRGLRSAPLSPVVGMAATLVVGSDAYPATVVSVSTTGHRIGYRLDRARGALFEPATGQIEFATLRADGHYRPVATRATNTYLALGQRRMVVDRAV